MANTNLKTSITYTANGTQKTFSIPFDYLRGTFVKVIVNNTTITSYLVINRTVEFDEAPASGTTITIYRETDTKPLVAWADASVLKAADMTISQVQQLHIIEEEQDWVITNSVVLDEADNKWEGRNHPLKNLADPTNPQDAVTKHYMETVQGGFVQENTALKNEATKQAQIATQKATEADVSAKAARVSETNAKASETNAKASETNAKASETNAKASETNAKASETAAAASETNAKASETNAKASETNAKSSEQAAKTSETNAKSSELKAKEWATKEPGEVEDGKYSAYHYALFGERQANRAESEADRAEDIANSLEGLSGITGLANKEEAEAGTVNDKAMTPLRVKESIKVNAPVKSVNGVVAGASGNIEIDIPDREVKSGEDVKNLPPGGFVFHGSAPVDDPDVVLAGSDFNGLHVYLSGQASQLLFGSGKLYHRVADKGNAGVLDWGKWNELAMKESSGVPVGTIIAFAGNSIPDGYLVCNGARVDIDIYPALYDVIRSTYGDTQDVTTFMLPNLINRFVQGSNTAGTVFVAGLPNITGQFRVRNNIGYGNNNNDYPPSGAFKEVRRTIRSEGNADDNMLDKVYEFKASYSSVVYGKSSTVQPPALTMRYLIKY